MGRWFLLTIVLTVSCWGSAWVRSDDVYRVGVAVVDVTPDYPIRLNGFGNRRAESEGVSQPIYARALAISQQGQAPLVLVTVDSLGLRMPMVDEVARRLHHSHQLPRQNLAVTFSHSHCTPKVNGACDNIFSQAIPTDHQSHIDRYTGELTDRITEAARQAINDRRSSRLEWAVGKVAFAKNRRTAGGPVDHDLPVLVVRDATSNQPRAIYVSYACHCVTLSFNRISGDWAGYAAAMIERMVPGAVGLVSIGAGSDQNPISGVTGDQVQVAEAQGIEIATEVQRLLAKDLSPISGPPAAVLNQIALPLNEVPTQAELLDQAHQGRPTDRYNATTQLARLQRGESLLAQIDYPIQTWTFGDRFCMVFLAGEVCVDYSLRLKTQFDRRRFWLNAYSNDFCCYIPSERLVREGGYGGGAEVPYFALPTTLRPGLEQLIVDEVQRQVPDAFHVPERTQGVPPKSPQDSLQSMQTHDHLQIHLVAAEPQVTDPVAIDFGTDGRLWVAEMNDYGRGVYEEFAQTSRIRWLRDNDHDGFFEQAQVFLDGLRFPTDVKVWREGVLICDAPDILFAKDSDGNGTADVVTKLFSGFEIRNAQARVNSLRFGLDNWIYGSCGLYGGKIISHQTGQTVDCSNRDFRINPDTGVIEPVSGRTQQGRCRNDWGDWYGCSNGTLLQPISADDRYLIRNPHAPPSRFPSVVIDAAAHQLYPPENLVTFELSGVPGRATSACGVGIYRDQALGTDYTDDAFTCEPVHQSVHRIDFSIDTGGFRGGRGAGEQSTEFLTSTDRWFRPVQARTGPDGALWVVDMYRFVIEHSRWIPQAALENLDVYAGQQLGRIFRITAKTATTSHPVAAAGELVPNLAALSNAALVGKLDSRNGPTRDLAHQLLLWRNAIDVTPSITELVQSADTPTGTIHALALLEGLHQLRAADVQSAVGSDRAEVVRFAVRLSEPFLDTSPALRDSVIGLADHNDPRVRRQVALSLGALTNQAATGALVRLLSNQEPDEHVRAAALNSVSKSNVETVLDEFQQLPEPERGPAMLQRLMLLATEIAEPELVNRMLMTLISDSAGYSEESVEFLVKVLDCLDGRSQRQPIQIDDAVRDGLQRLHQMAMNDVAVANQENAICLAALTLLGRPFGSFRKAILVEGSGNRQLDAVARIEAMQAQVSPRAAVALQRRAIAAIAATGSTKAAPALLGVWSSLGHEARLTVIDVLLGQQNGPDALVDALRAGDVRPEIFDAPRRSKLLSNLGTENRAAVDELFGSQRSSSRADVVRGLREAIHLTGEADRGRVVFRKHCSSCHRLEDHGHAVGPDLRALTNHDPMWLLTAMLDPNRDVDGRYISWVAITVDGQTVSGLIVEETATAIHLRESGGKDHVIARADLEAIRSTQRSVMPEGLERDMSAQEFSDVIAFLTQFESAPKSLAGNQPTVIQPNRDGMLMLTANTAEIRGGRITFESEHANIGYWHDQQDTATWKIDVPAAAEFDVYIEAACADDSAGNAFRIDGLPDPIQGTVVGTGGWGWYRHRKVGFAALEAGSHLIVVRAAGPVDQALFDLREVRLVPVGAAPMFQRDELAKAPLPRYPPQIAPFLLDASESVERRQQVIDQRPGMGPAIIGLLVSDLPPGDIQEEYRRIPWIWRVAIAVGKRNDGGELRDLLEVCLPPQGQRLNDWQAVAIGGGLINGISQIDLWPHQRIAEVLAGLPSASSAWPAALQLAAEMADDEQVREGTRYDALRMVALLDDAAGTQQLLRYLPEGTSAELQMGAVSGLADIDSTAVIEPLLDALQHLQGTNRNLAIEGLLRTADRARSLANRVQSGQLVLTEAEVNMLTRHTVDSIRRHAQSIFGNNDEN